MAYEIPVQTTSLITGADLSGKQFYAVKINSSGNAVLAGAGEVAVGILQDTPVSGQVCNVMVLGETKAIYGGNVTAGAKLASDANGKLVAVTSTESVVGIAKQSGALNEIHTVILRW